jgi:hypothetical protein
MVWLGQNLARQFPDFPCRFPDEQGIGIRDHIEQDCVLRHAVVRLHCDSWPQQDRHKMTKDVSTVRLSAIYAGLCVLCCLAALPEWSEKSTRLDLGKQLFGQPAKMLRCTIASST